jgi:uncharacterized protein (DUF305 family)
MDPHRVNTGSRARPLLVALAGLLTVARVLSAQRPTPGTRDYTDADARFVTAMIAHHAQAVVMSDWAPTHGASPNLLVLCKRIALSQRDEITVMRRWLADRELSVPDTVMAGMDMGPEPMPMTGMLTSAEMRQLDAAHDTAFDRLYLTGMIKHHQGAIAMVAALFATPRGGQQADLFSLATDVDAGQRVEIARMQAMLHTLTPTPPT